MLRMTDTLLLSSETQPLPSLVYCSPSHIISIILININNKVNPIIGSSLCSFSKYADVHFQLHVEPLRAAPRSIAALSCSFLNNALKYLWGGNLILVRETGQEHY
jgi:hypothetical protein